MPRLVMNFRPGGFLVEPPGLFVPSATSPLPPFPFFDGVPDLCRAGTGRNRLPLFPCLPQEHP